MAAYHSWNPELFKWHMTYDHEHDRDADTVEEWLRYAIRPCWRHEHTVQWLRLVRELRPNLLQATHWMQAYLVGEAELEQVHIANISEWHEVDDVCRLYDGSSFGGDTRLHKAREAMYERCEELLNPFATAAP